MIKFTLDYLNLIHLCKVTINASKKKIVVFWDGKIETETFADQADFDAADDHKFGDAIFLADAGVQFCPSDMGVKPLNGMHGFDPADRDSCAAWLSTVPVPDGVSRVCDYFRVMTEE